MISNRNIDEFITCAIDILENEKEIVKNGKIKKGYSSQISTFGSAISTGSLLSGIAYFSKSGDSSVNRSRLMWIIYEILKNTNRLNPNLQKEIKNEVPELELYNYVKKFTQNKNKTEIIKLKRTIIEVATAIKLAMNYFVIENTNLEEEKTNEW